MSDADEAPTGLVTGLQVIAIYVTDLERAREFYEGLLGFTESGAMPPGILLSSGGLTLYVEPGKPEGSGDPARTSFVAPVFGAESVLAVHEKLVAAGVPMHGELQQAGDQFAFFQCKDPDGNVVEFAGKP
jgi:catechol 2,3-dioxygenase-like lactoylglutathione lyase family enzyme